MPEADLGKIVGMIMENPELVESIRKMGENTDSKEEPQKEPEQVTTVSDIPMRPRGESSKRSELLRAISGFLSPERQRALESMISVASVLDTMKSK